MKNKILIALGLVILIALSYLYSFPVITETLYDADLIVGTVGDIVKDKEVRNEFVAEKDNLGSISLKLGTFNRKDLTTLDVQILDDKKQIVVQKSVDLQLVKDNEFCKISFDPYSESSNKKFTLIITSPDAVPDNSVSIYTYQPKGSASNLYIDDVKQESVLALRASYYDNFDIATFIVLMYFITVIIFFTIYIYKFI